MTHDDLFKIIWPLLQDHRAPDLPTLQETLNSASRDALSSHTARTRFIQSIDEAMANHPHHRETERSQDGQRRWWLEPTFHLTHIQGQIAFAMTPRRLRGAPQGAMFIHIMGRFRLTPSSPWQSIGHFDGQLNPHRRSARDRLNAKDITLEAVFRALDRSCDPDHEPFKRFQAIEETLLTQGGDAAALQQWLNEQTPRFGRMAQRHLQHVALPGRFSFLHPDLHSDGWVASPQTAPPGWSIEDDGVPMTLFIKLMDPDRWLIEAEGATVTFEVGECRRLNQVPALLEDFKTSRAERALQTAQEPPERATPMRVADVINELRHIIYAPSGLDLDAIHNAIVPDEHSAYTSADDLKIVVNYLHDQLELRPRHRDIERDRHNDRRWWFAPQSPSTHLHHQRGVSCNYWTQRLDCDLKLKLMWHGRVRFRETEPWTDLHLFMKRARSWRQPEQWTDPALNVSNFSGSPLKRRAQQLSLQLQRLDQLAEQEADLLARFTGVGPRLKDSEGSCALALDWMLEHNPRFGLFTQRYFHTAVLPQLYPFLIGAPEGDPPSLHPSDGILLSWTFQEDASTLLPIINLTHDGWLLEVEGGKTNYELGQYRRLSDALRALRDAEANPHHDFVRRDQR